MTTAPASEVKTPPATGSPSHGSGRGRWGFTVMGTMTAAVVIAVVIVPLVMMVVRLFFPELRFDGEPFINTLNDPSLWTVLRNTFIAVGAGTILATIIGSLFAWLNERTNARMGWITDSLPVLPLFLPQLAAAIGWLFLATPGPGLLNVLSREIGGLLGIEVSSDGPFNVFGWPGLIFLYTLTLVPLIYISVSAPLRNLAGDLEEASRLSGAGPVRTLLKVTLPAVKPGIIAGILLSLAAGFALYSMPVIIGTRAGIEILSVRIVHFTTNTYPPKLAEAVVLGLVVLAVVSTTMLIQRRVLRAGHFARIEGKSGGVSAVDLGVWRWPARIIMLGFLAATAVLPFLALVWVSIENFWSGTLNLANLTFRHYETVFSGRSFVLDALQNSVVLAVGTATAAMLLAAILAYFNERRPRNTFGQFAGATMKLPAGVSNLVIALGLIAALAGPPIGLYGTLTILFIGYLVSYFPQASISAGPALAQVGPSLTEASLLSGASEMRTFRRVVIPLMLPGLVAGWALVFKLTLADLTTSVMLASPQTPVVGFTLLNLVSNGTYGPVAALSVVVTVISATIALLALGYGRRNAYRVAAGRTSGRKARRTVRVPTTG